MTQPQSYTQCCSVTLLACTVQLSIAFELNGFDLVNICEIFNFIETIIFTESVVECQHNVQRARQRYLQSLIKVKKQFIS